MILAAAWPSRAVGAGERAFTQYFNRAQNDSAPADAADDYGSAIEHWRPEKGDILLAACYFGRAQAYYSLGELSKSASDASQSLALDSGNQRAYMVRGQARLALGLYREAERDFMVASRRDPRGEEAVYDLALAQFRLGQRALALKNFKAAQALAAEDFRPIEAEAALWKDRERCDMAAPLYRKAQALSERAEASSSAGLGYCAYRGKKFQQALPYYSQAVESWNSALEDLIRGQAPLYKKNELQGKLARTYFWRGMDYEEMRQDRGALSDYRKSCALGYGRACSRKNFLQKRPKTARFKQKKQRKAIYKEDLNSPGARIYIP